MPEFRYVGLAALQARGMAAINAAVRESAEHLVGAAQANSDVDTGTQRAGIHVADVSGGGMSVTAKVATGGESSGYSIYNHEGTSAHVIRARPGGVLAFSGRFATSVQHPGTAPSKFMERAVIAGRPVYLAAMAAAARRYY